jgi:hypothetical protein
MCGSGARIQLTSKERLSQKCYTYIYLYIYIYIYIGILKSTIYIYIYIYIRARTHTQHTHTHTTKYDTYKVCVDVVTFVQQKYLDSHFSEFVAGKADPGPR